MNDVIKKYNQVIEDLSIMESNLKVLKEQKKNMEKAAKAYINMEKWKERYGTESIDHVIHSLVKQDESFAEWLERHGKYLRGYKQSGEDWAKQHYQERKESTSHNYIKWMLIVDDERIHDTEIYKSYNQKDV